MLAALSVPDQCSVYMRRNQTAHSKATSWAIYSVFLDVSSDKETRTVELAGPGKVTAVFHNKGAYEAANTMSLFLSKPVM